MKEIRLTVRCTHNPDHAKVLRLDPKLATMGDAEKLARLLDGSSSMYINRPGEGSPIGRCAICHAELETTVQEFDDGSQPVV